MGIKMGTEDAKSLIKRFHTLQQERVETYKLFDEGHAAYMEAAPNYNFPMYKQLVHEITQTFKRISDDILVIKERLTSTYNQPSMGNFIGKVQDKEHEKLQMTAKLQIAKQNVVDHPEDQEHRETVQELQDGLKEKIAEINDLLEELKYECEDLMVS